MKRIVAKGRIETQVTDMRYIEQAVLENFGFAPQGNGVWVSENVGLVPEDLDENSDIFELTETLAEMVDRTGLPVKLTIDITAQ